MKDYLAFNEATYDAVADEYGQRISEYSRRDRKLMEPFLSALSVQGGYQGVLELGPGSGLCSKILADEGFDTTAVELAGKIIDIAKRTSPSTMFIHDDFLSHDFGDKTFDGVFAKAFIHLFPKNDALKVMGKIAQLTNPGGVLFLATTVHDVPSEGYEGKADYADTPLRFRKKWTVDELHKALKSDWRIIDENFNEERGKKWLAITSTRVS